jgi:hypothetical protein
MAIEERHDTIIEQIGCRRRCLAAVEFGKCHLRVGIDKGPLLEAPQAFEGTDIKGVLRAAVVGALRFELAVRLPFSPKPRKSGTAVDGRRKNFKIYVNESKQSGLHAFRCRQQLPGQLGQRLRYGQERAHSNSLPRNSTDVQPIDGRTGLVVDVSSSIAIFIQVWSAKALHRRVVGLIEEPCRLVFRHRSFD